jgi:ankyrin repeat protein
MRPISSCGWTLNRAAAFCTLEIFTLLLTHSADIRNATPLHYAAGYGRSPDDPPISNRIPMLEYLVGLGLEVNAPDDAVTISEDDRGRVGTPISYAVMWGRVEEATWLLEKGADPGRKSTYGFSARDLAERRPPENEMRTLFRDHPFTASDQ